MKFRVARHTSDLSKIKSFYADLMGLEVLGTFENHDGYNGLFLGIRNENWHLEFTQSNESPMHTPDPDDLLVFYFTQAEFDQAQERIINLNVRAVNAKNSYWNRNGITVVDPDGFRVVLAVK